MTIRFCLLVTILAAMCCVLPLEASAAHLESSRSNPRLELVRTEAARLIEEASRPEQTDEADPAAEAAHLLARVARYADPRRDREAFVLAAHALRVTTMLGALTPEDRERIAPLLTDDEALSREVAFAWWEGHDDPIKVLHVLRDLADTHTVDRLAEAPRLVAALCVVHDDPRLMRLNENRARPERPARLFEYYTTARMNPLVANLPPELLVWGVDAVDADELAWVNREHAGHQRVGTLFHTIDYDHEHFRLGQPKKVTQAGLSLPNIARHGGVCIDQAHYAVQTARAIGVPAAICRGRSSEVSHAWVGYLEVRGRRAWWNFDEGRYTEYAKVRGNVVDPQRREIIPDGEAAARAASYGLDADKRHQAAALHDAAAVMGAYEGGWTDDVQPFIKNAKQRRDATAADRLELLEASVTLNAGELRSWEAVTDLAGSMDDRAKDRWATAAMRLAGSGFKEFAVDFSMPLVESVEDVAARSAVLGRLFEYTKADRPGVAAEIMIANAQLYATTGDSERAYAAYAFTAVEYADTSSLAVTALRRAMVMLREHGHTTRAVDLARSAWSKTTQPSSSAPEFAGQSNWSRIGALYVAALKEDGRTNEAQTIERQLGGSSAR